MFRARRVATAATRAGQVLNAVVLRPSLWVSAWIAVVVAIIAPAAPVSPGGASATVPPPEPRVLVRTVADAVLRDFPNPPPFDWGEGVLMSGMMRAWRLTGEDRYLEFVRRFADGWLQKGIEPLLKEKGYCGRWMPGAALLMLHQATGEQRYAEGYQRILRFITREAGRTSDGGFDHFTGKPELWADTLYMCVPLLSEASVADAKPEWQAEAARQLEIFARHLQDTNSGLFYHLWDESNGRRTAPFWARGNGWVVMSFADMLPREQDPARAAALRTMFAKLLAGIAATQDATTGLWRTVLDAPDTYLETSASAMFVYGLAVNERLGLCPGLDRNIARKAWNGIAAQVDSAGRVQGVSAGTTPGEKQRYARVPQGVFTWGTGAFLLAACAVEEAGLAQNLPARITARDGSEMLLVAGGPFLMGSLDGAADEKPPRIINLPALYIDRYEVTCEQYAAFLLATRRAAPVTWPGGRMPPKLARHPVVNVTFADAEAYADWAGKRLPTEAEWEKAARGPDGRIYPWGNSLAGKKTATPLGDNSKDHTWPVGSFPDDVAACGAMDIVGNAWEWTASWYDAYPGNEQLEIEYGKKYRVIRGGGAIDYYGVTSTGRCAARGRSLPYGSYDALGFRCVMNAETSAQATAPAPNQKGRP